MKGYSYTIELVGRMAEVVLIELRSNKVLVFRLAGKESLDGINSHMASMTDDNCAGFFKERKK